MILLRTLIITIRYFLSYVSVHTFTTAFYLGLYQDCYWKYLGSAQFVDVFSGILILDTS